MLVNIAKQLFIKQFFFSASLTIICLLAVCALYTHSAQALFTHLQKTFTQYAAWFYVLVATTLLIIVLIIAFSRAGNIKLGPDHSEPDYSYASWFAMLFSAGMGIGIVFFGVAEPVLHFLHPPFGVGGSAAAARQAMNLTFFHWGLHAWGIYAIVALVLAYYGYRHKLPLTLRSALYPILGRRVYGKVGDIVDIFAIVSTVFGIATSLGFGALQINAGLGYLFHMPQSVGAQVSLIAVVTLLATISVASGLDRGIKFLSELNLIGALVLMVLIICLGPTLFILNTMVQNIAAYFANLVRMSLQLYAYEPTSWTGQWTIFYWAWWISWSPFVGMFIARISRGRTIREFVLGTLFVPSGLTFIWMSVFGDSAIHLILFQGIHELGAAVEMDKATALFKFLTYFPWSGLLTYLVIAMIAIFFVTSCDSGALVIDILASGGKQNTPVWQRVYWALVVGFVAAILLFMGGLQALQTATILTALPFAIVLLLSAYGLLKSLYIERAKKQSLYYSGGTPNQPTHSDESDWKERFEQLLQLPAAKHVQQFIDSIVTDALTAVAEEFKGKGIPTELKAEEKNVSLLVKHGEEINFIYSVHCRHYEPPSFVLSALHKARGAKQKYFRAEVLLREGSQHYDLMGYSCEQIIHDVLDQYEKHIYFLKLIR